MRQTARDSTLEALAPVAWASPGDGWSTLALPPRPPTDVSEEPHGQSIL
jgi:hypothetical protein